MTITFHPLGDRAIQLVFSNKISKQTIQKIKSYTTLLESESIQGLIEWIPAYTTLTILYDPAIIQYEELVEMLNQIKVKEASEVPQSFIYELPICYGGDFGPDLSYVASYHSLTEDEVINIHSSRDYFIYMIGFAPGFPYLGGMSIKISTPRLDRPRKKVAAGSAGIAGEQTGIYPLDSPGGWRIIGRTPIPLYNPNNEQPILLSPGNYLRFKPISLQQFYDIKKQNENGTYEITKYPKEE